MGKDNLTGSGIDIRDSQPWWLDLILIGFEDDDDDSDDEEESDDEDDEDDSDDEEDESEEEEEDEDDDESKEDEASKSKKNIKGLKSALDKEREARKKYKRLYLQEKAKGRTTSNKSTKKKDEKSEDDSSQQGPTDREQRLAERLRNQEIDGVILRLASKMNFADPEDAVKLVKRREIIFDQDEDDPTEIEVDEESVEDALKELARGKKHLLATRNGSGSRTGSKMGGKKKSKDDASDKDIRERYGLRRL